MPRILIAGAGYVGARLGELCARRGDEVLCLRRSAQGLPRGLVPVVADLLDPSSLDALSGELDAVVFAAGPGESTREAYRRTYLVGLENLLNAVGHRARRVLFTSSTAVYAQSDGGWVDETSPATSTHFSGATLLEAEARLLERCPGAVVLRLGGIYGPGRASMVEAIRRGDASYFAGDTHFVNRFHRDDCAGALLHLLDCSEPESIYLGVDDEPTPRRDVMQWIAEQLGAPPPRAIEHEAPNPRRGGGHKRCSNARLRATGYALRYPTYRQGYAAVIAELGARPKLE